MDYSESLFGHDVDLQEEGCSLVPAVVDYRASLDVKQIMQPKTVTRARYRISKIHYQMLVRIREELQSYITNNPDEVRSGQFITVPLFCSHYPHFRGNGLAFLNSVKEFMLRDNVISFEWRFNASFHKDLFLWMQRGTTGRGAGRLVEPKDGMLIQQASVIIVDAVRCENDPQKVIVSINPHVLPFLLYYGPGVGGTCFDRDVLLSMNGWFSCRLYENIMDWSTSVSSKVVSLEELRSLLQYPESYKVHDIKRKILDIAKREFEDNGSSVLFDYKFKFDSQFGSATGARGPLPANCVEFTIYKKQYMDWKELSRKQVLVMLQGVAEREKMHLCVPLAKQIVDNGQESVIKSKFAYYDKKVHEGRITPQEYVNTMLKIVREVTGTDLRSDAHVRNSARVRRRSRKVDNEPKLLFGE